MTLFRTLLLLLALSLPGWAALPLKAIREYQKSAPEHLHLDIVRVKQKKTWKGGTHYYSLTVEARVSKVLRSKSGLKPGVVINLRYDVPNLRKSPMAGDWAGTVKEGAYEAYLKLADKAANLYKPAAHSGSFQKLKAKDS